MHVRLSNAPIYVLVLKCTPINFDSVATAWIPAPIIVGVIVVAIGITLVVLCIVLCICLVHKRVMKTGNWDQVCNTGHYARLGIQ